MIWEHNNRLVKMRTYDNYLHNTSVLKIRHYHSNSKNWISEDSCYRYMPYTSGMLLNKAIRTEFTVGTYKRNSRVHLSDNDVALSLNVYVPDRL